MVAGVEAAGDAMPATRRPAAGREGGNEQVMRRITVPLWIQGVSRPRAAAFVGLFVLDATCRALLMTLVPLQLNHLLGNAQLVSIAYTAAGLAALVGVLAMPAVIRVIRRRGAVTMGALFYVGAVALYATGRAPTAMLGLGLQVLASACLEISLSLYVLDHVPRRELNRFEPLRLVWAGLSFVFGPWLGVTLAARISPNLTYALVAVAAAALLGYFWFLRITEDPVVSHRGAPPANPLRFLPRFLRQPRLRLAWGLALGRTSFWVMFFVYAPIFVTQQGYSEETAGLVVSFSTAALFLVPLWARIGRRYGLRALLLMGYGFTGIACLAVWPAMAVPMLATGFVVLAGLVASMIDGAGNVPFLRAVHPYERGEMTAVFTTYRQTAQLGMPAVFSGLLGVMPLPAVFTFGGVMLAVATGLARFLPKRL